jgi:hypothetical protein
MTTPASYLNELFASHLDTESGKEKVAEFGGVYIRDRLREVSFARKILPPEQVTRADCQRSVNHDTLVKIVDIEPQSRAMPLTFRGEPTARFISAERYEIPFFTIASEKFEKVEQELLAYEMPITKVIEDNSVKDIQEVEDFTFLQHVDACVEALYNETWGAVAFNRTNVNAGTVTGISKVKGTLALAGAGVDTFGLFPMQRPDVVNLMKLLNTNRLRGEIMLMTEPDYTDVLQWTSEDFGDKMESETAVEGYKYNTILGLRFVRTIKTDILRPGNVYLFTAPEFFGKFFILNNTKFWVDKRMNMITWASWEDIGMGLGNISAVRKLELYQGSCTPGAVTAGFAAVVPSELEDLGAVNNRAAAGLTYPVVNQF